MCEKITKKNVRTKFRLHNMLSDIYQKWFKHWVNYSFHFPFWRRHQAHLPFAFQPIAIVILPDLYDARIYFFSWDRLNVKTSSYQAIVSPFFGISIFFVLLSKQWQQQPQTDSPRTSNAKILPVFRYTSIEHTHTLTHTLTHISLVGVEVYVRAEYKNKFFQRNLSERKWNRPSKSHY